MATSLPLPLVNHPDYTVTVREEARYHRALLVLSALPILALVVASYAPQHNVQDVWPLILMAVAAIAQGRASDPATKALWDNRAPGAPPSVMDAARALGNALRDVSHREWYAMVGSATLGVVTSGDSIWMVIAPLAWGWWRYASYARTRYRHA